MELDPKDPTELAGQKAPEVEMDLESRLVDLEDQEVEVDLEDLQLYLKLENQKAMVDLEADPDNRGVRVDLEVDLEVWVD